MWSMEMLEKWCAHKICNKNVPVDWCHGLTFVSKQTDQLLENIKHKHRRAMQKTVHNITPDHIQAIYSSFFTSNEIKMNNLFSGNMAWLWGFLCCVCKTSDTTYDFCSPELAYVTISFNDSICFVLSHVLCKQFIILLIALIYAGSSLSRQP